MLKFIKRLLLGYTKNSMKIIFVHTYRYLILDIYVYIANMCKLTYKYMCVHKIIEIIRRFCINSINYIRILDNT